MRLGEKGYGARWMYFPAKIVLFSYHTKTQPPLGWIAAAILGIALYAALGLPQKNSATVLEIKLSPAPGPKKILNRTKSLEKSSAKPCLDGVFFSSWEMGRSTSPKSTLKVGRRGGGNSSSHF